MRKLKKGRFWVQRFRVLGSGFSGSGFRGSGFWVQRFRPGACLKSDQSNRKKSF
jgi:hypothetical protein